MKPQGSVATTKETVGDRNFQITYCIMKKMVVRLLNLKSKSLFDISMLPKVSIAGTFLPKTGVSDGSNCFNSQVNFFYWAQLKQKLLSTCLATSTGVKLVGKNKKQTLMIIPKNE